MNELFDIEGQIQTIYRTKGLKDLTGQPVTLTSFALYGVTGWYKLGTEELDDGLRGETVQFQSDRKGNVVPDSLRPKTESESPEPTEPAPTEPTVQTRQQEFEALLQRQREARQANRANRDRGTA